MGITLTIQASLVLIMLGAFFIIFVINKYNRKFTGGCTILLGLAVASLGTTLTDIGNMTAIIATIIVFAGILILLDGWINKR